jgi:hypothetical protein
MVMAMRMKDLVGSIAVRAGGKALRLRFRN